MTGHEDFDRTLAGWFEADARSPAPAGGLDRVVDATRRRRPRPAWLAGPGSHWVGETHIAGSSSGARSLPRLGMRWSTALILLLAIATLVGGAILVGARLLQPSPLPTGRLGHLAYGLDGDIYVADWDGRNPIRIADGAPGGGPTHCDSFWGEGPMWSPDGRHLAYRSGCDDPSRATVFISDPAGHVVASFPGSGWLVSWSPDSTRVATWVELSQIGIYGLDGVRQALLTLPPGLGPPGDYDPKWSPDGRSLLMRLAPPMPSEVWELPIDGGTPRRVPDEDPRSHFNAANSRDGVSSATGDRIAFTVKRNATPAQTPDADAWDLRVIDVSSGAVTTLVRAPEGSEAPRPTGFSPEGDRILFRQGGADGGSLWSINVDGSNAQLLVTGTDWGDWQWQPADH